MPMVHRVSCRAFGMDAPAGTALPSQRAFRPAPGAAMNPASRQAAQTARPLGIAQQYAALPWRISRDGFLEVLLVTTRRRSRWIVPKGWRAVMVSAGVPGILITSPPVGPQKIARYLALIEKAPDTRTVVDDAEPAKALACALGERQLRGGVLLDIDVGQNRTGIAPDSATELASAISAMPALRLDGLQAYAGHVQRVRDAATRRQAACVVHDMVGALRRRLAGLLPERPIVSGGGTGTHAFDADGSPFTELQAGSYIFMDAEYEDVEPVKGARWPFLTSLHLQTMVISSPRAGAVTTDAGTKAVAVNGPPPRIVTLPYTDFPYRFSGDEPGCVLVPEGAGAPPIGTLLECIVSHCDPTVALHERLYAIRGGQIVDVLAIDARGRR